MHKTNVFPRFFSADALHCEADLHRVGSMLHRNGVNNGNSSKRAHLFEYARRIESECLSFCTKDETNVSAAQSL